MKIQLPGNAKLLIDTLTRAGYEAYAVGGCVRDSVLGRTPGDWDITTSASPQQVKEIFPRTVDTGIQHGTVTVLEGTEAFEVTTYRIDGEYEDGRHPKEVAFTSDLMEDLKRRDFTINAMAYNESEGLIDAFGGIADLKKRMIRCVGNPTDRFTEDALRMMRAVRFAAQLGFSIEEETKAAAAELAPNLARISAERIQVELVKLLVSDHPEEIRTLYEIGLTKTFLPEFDEMMQTPQNNRYHCYNVGEHSIVALQNMAKEILRRLKFDNQTINRVTALIACHDQMPSLREASVRHAMHKIGLAQYPALFEVKRSDVMAKSEYGRKDRLEAICAYERIYQDILKKNQCLSLKDLAVNGNDVKQLGMGQGKQVGAVLDRLLDHVLDHPEDNTREKLLNFIKTELKPE